MKEPFLDLTIDDTILKLRNWIQIIPRHYGLLVLGTILAMECSYLALRFLTPWPQYQAKTTVLVTANNLNRDFIPLQVRRELVTTYADWVKRRPVLQGVVDSLDLPYSADELDERMEVRVVGDTGVMEITATSNDAQQSADIANELIKQLEKQFEDTTSTLYDLPYPQKDEIVQLQARINAAMAELNSLSDTLANYQHQSPDFNEISKLETYINKSGVELLNLSEALLNYQTASPASSEIEELENRIYEAENEISTLTTQLLATEYTPSADLLNRRIKVLQDNLNWWKGELDNLYSRSESNSEAEMRQLARRITVLQTNIELWQKELNRLNGLADSRSEAEIDRLIKRTNVLQSNIWIWQREADDLWANTPAFPLIVIEKAEAPVRAVTPLGNILVAGATGLILTVGVIFLFNKLLREVS